MIVFVICLSSLLALSFLAFLFMAKRFYFKWFVRDKPGKFPRHCSLPNDVNKTMYEEGLAYSKKSKAKQIPVSLENDGLHLKGIFMDFGRKDCVIIYPGYAETVDCSYYFAMIYENSSYNVLLIDPRCFGMSEGRYFTAGVKEKEDLLAWASFAHSSLHQGHVLFHGICVGGATSLMALADPSCPDFVFGAIAEGPFSDFQEALRYHALRDGHRRFPVVDMMPFFFRCCARANIKKDCPRNQVSAIRKPVLFLQGKEDALIPWKDTEELYQKCGSQDKHIIYFEHGSHSHLRQSNPEFYDRDILLFIEAFHS